MAATSAQQKRRERETTIAGAKRNASKLQSAQIVMQLMNYQLPGPENRPDWGGAGGVANWLWNEQQICNNYGCDMS